jgi:outer membrane protein assembly factor BamB
VISINSLFSSCALILLATASTLHSADARRWPQFRGPGSRGVAEGQGFPSEWDTNRNVRWSVDVPGVGWSSPIVWGDQILITTVVSEGAPETPKKGLYFGGERPTPAPGRHQWMVYCLNWTDGKIAWKKEVHAGESPNPLHVKNTYASETPVTDGERVYAYFGNVGLFCLGLDGKEVWSRKWPAVKTRYGWGSAASPVLQGDRVYVVNDNESQSFIVALNKHTGEEIWRVERDEPSNWATPYVWQNAQRTEIVTPGRKKVRSYDLEGKVLWELGGMSTIVIPTPFSAFDLLYVCSGYVGDSTRPVFAVRPGASGDISLNDGQTNKFIAWYGKTAAPYNPSPMVYGDYFYVLFDFGFLSCHDARTGRVAFEKQRIDPKGSVAFTASPWAADGRIFCLSEDGDTYVFKAGPRYELLRKNSLGEMCMATPAVVDKSFIIRTYSKLYRIGER